jgi:hypothetical protein
MRHSVWTQSSIKRRQAKSNDFFERGILLTVKANSRKCIVLE